MKSIFKNPLFYLILISILIYACNFPRLFFHPNAYLLNAYGDAFKNYFTPCWYTKYDIGLHFSGMNYPFGDQIVFSDNQPAISMCIQFIDAHIISCASYTIGILHTTVFLSNFLCIIFLYKILKHFLMPGWYAAVAALLIGLMSPQLDRLWGHYALAYTCFVPCIWYFMIYAKKKNYTPYVLMLGGIIICFFGFIHLYYLLIAVVFISSYLFVYLFQKEKKKREILSLIAFAFIPLLIVLSILHITDPISDRPETPFGFTHYKASFQSVFIPNDGTIFHFFSNVFHLNKGNSEGYAYVGFVSFVAILCIFFGYFYFLLKKKNIVSFQIFFPKDYKIYFVSSILILLFSMALPFTLGLESLLEILTPLKQFRSPGRFAWVFYYICTVFSFMLVYELFKNMLIRKKRLAIVFLILVLLVQISDVYSYFIKTTDQLNHNLTENFFLKNNFEIETELNQIGKYTSHFQAILYLPAFFLGSEKLYVEQEGIHYKTAMEIAYETGLPLVDHMMSRTSVSQTLQLAQLAAHPTIKKNIPIQLLQKPILLVVKGTELKIGEKYLIDHSTFLFAKEDIKFYEIKLTDVQNSDEQTITYFQLNKDALIYNDQEQYYSALPLQLFYRESFETTPHENSFAGKGSLFIEEGKEKIAEIPVEIKEPIWIEISLWVNTFLQTSAYPYILIDFLNEENNLLKTTSVAPKFSVDNMHGWVRGGENFEVPVECKQLVIKTNKDKMIQMDELVVRHTAESVFYGEDSTGNFWFNNYPLVK